MTSYCFLSGGKFKLMKKHILISIIMLGTTPLIAQQKLSPEKLWQLGRVSGDIINKKKNEVIYSVNSINIEENKGNKNTFAISLKNGKSKQINTENESIIVVDIHQDQLIYLKNDQLWSCGLDYTEHKQLTNLEG